MQIRGLPMFDFSSLMNIKNHWNVFKGNHPKVDEFRRSVGSKGFCEGQEIAVAVRYPDGTEYKTGIRLRQSDLAFIEAIRNITGSM